MCKERARFWFQAIWYGWWRVVIGLFTVIGIYDTVVAQLFPRSDLQPIAHYFPIIEWWVWWIVLLIVIIIALLEGSFRLNRELVRQAKQRVIHSDSANRLFAIDIGNCHILESQNPSKLEMVIHILTLTAFPSQAIEGIYLKLHGDKYKESTGAFIRGGKTVFKHSPTFGLGVCFELPSNLSRGTYSAQIIVYVDGREETQDFKFEY